MHNLPDDATMFAEHPASPMFAHSRTDTVREASEEDHLNARDKLVKMIDALDQFTTPDGPVWNEWHRERAGLVEQMWSYLPDVERLLEAAEEHAADAERDYPEQH